MSIHMPTWYWAHVLTYVVEATASQRFNFTNWSLHLRPYMRQHCTTYCFCLSPATCFFILTPISPSSLRNFLSFRWLRVFLRAWTALAYKVSACPCIFGALRLCLFSFASYLLTYHITWHNIETESFSSSSKCAQQNSKKICYFSDCLYLSMKCLLGFFHSFETESTESLLKVIDKISHAGMYLYI